jgi:hypothetical protein
LIGKATGRITTGLQPLVSDHEATERLFYHNGGNGKPTALLAQRQIIAWDGEGMSLSGESKPQHLVIFGCSADSGSPIVGRDLRVGDILRYITDIGERHPKAVHIGYGFRYDANMIIRHLPLRCLTEIREKGATFYNYGGAHYRIHILPGKRFQVTRRQGKDRVTVTIDDILPFFASTFPSGDGKHPG